MKKQNIGNRITKIKPTSLNNPNTYEIQTLDGKVVYSCRTWGHANKKLPRLEEEYFQRLKLVKVK